MEEKFVAIVRHYADGTVDYVGPIPASQDDVILQEERNARLAMSEIEPDDRFKCVGFHVEAVGEYCNI